jgi:DNA polymerase elongation subunit (family B)
MGFLFIDIESFVASDNERSGLNPHHLESAVIVIAYNYYNLLKAPIASEIKKPEFLYIWKEGGEKELLQKFYNILDKIYASDQFLKIVGFNHLAYDLPYLFSRMQKHGIASEINLFDYIFSKARHIDLAQLGMAISEKTKKDEDFRCISQKVINSYFDIPIKEADGKDVSRFYEKQRYDLIEKYVVEEFTFETLYLSVLDYFIFVN